MKSDIFVGGLALDQRIDSSSTVTDGKARVTQEECRHAGSRGRRNIWKYSSENYLD